MIIEYVFIDTCMNAAFSICYQNICQTYSLALSCRTASYKLCHGSGKLYAHYSDNVNECRLHLDMKILYGDLFLHFLHRKTKNKDKITLSPIVKKLISVLNSQNTKLEKPN